SSTLSVLLRRGRPREIARRVGYNCSGRQEIFAWDERGNFGSVTNCRGERSVATALWAVNLLQVLLRSRPATGRRLQSRAASGLILFSFYHPMQSQSWHEKEKYDYDT